MGQGFIINIFINVLLVLITNILPVLPVAPKNNRRDTTKQGERAKVLVIHLISNGKQNPR